MKKWTIEDSKEIYNIKGWGVNFFGVNEKGHVYVTPKKNNVQVDLKEVVDELAAAHISAPLLLRFPDILDTRIQSTAACFEKATKEYNFKGDHYIVFPIKVNQMRPVIEEIISHGAKYNIGLEAGSKPELHAVLAQHMDSDSIVICNGHKDQNFIEMALLAQKMGKRLFLVIEKLPELRIIAETAAKLNVRPNLGIRIKLASSGAGKWQESGGDASKFGLNSSELLLALEMLDKMGLRDCLKLIHFHIGSQITKIRRISTALREAAQYYVQLHQMGFGIEFVDCGGGLGVDYDGTRSSNSESSVNYSIQEYVNDCVYTFVDAADKNNIPHPTLISEGGGEKSEILPLLIVQPPILPPPLFKFQPVPLNPLALIVTPPTVPPVAVILLVSKAPLPLIFKTSFTSNTGKSLFTSIPLVITNPSELRVFPLILKPPIVQLLSFNLNTVVLLVSLVFHSKIFSSSDPGLLLILTSEK